jgi:hypothetical protein
LAQGSAKRRAAAVSGTANRRRRHCTARGRSAHYFAHKNFPVYVVDHVGRGRSYPQRNESDHPARLRRWYVSYRFQSLLNRGVCGNLVPLGSEIL